VDELNRSEIPGGTAGSEKDGRQSHPGKANFLDQLVSTGLGTGLSPVAPGTVGSLLALLIYFLPGFEKPYFIIPAIIVFFAWGTHAAGRMEKSYGHDPSRVVIDEIVAMWISVLFLPKRLLLAVMAFLIFRILDIFKPFPANYFDKRDGGVFIMLDDVVCGVYTSLLLHIYIFLGR
jgi:phosphatidylglycerophosphatase A